MTRDPKSPLKLLRVVVLAFMVLNIVAVLFTAFELAQGRAVPITLGEQTFSHPSAQMYGLFLVLVVAVQGLAWLFFTFIGRVLRGQLFIAQNVRDLRFIAFAGLTWWGLSPLLELGQTQGAVKSIQFGLSTNIFFSAKFLVPLLLLTFAEVLSEGLRLRESEMVLRQEQELTV